jgi:hypothetical protein
VRRSLWVFLGSLLWASWVVPVYLRVPYAFFNKVFLTYKKKKKKKNNEGDSGTTHFTQQADGNLKNPF